MVWPRKANDKQNMAPKTMDMVDGNQKQKGKTHVSSGMSDKKAMKDRSLQRQTAEVDPDGDYGDACNLKYT